MADQDPLAPAQAQAAVEQEPVDQDRADQVVVLAQVRAVVAQELADMAGQDPEAQAPADQVPAQAQAAVEQEPVARVVDLELALAVVEQELVDMAIRVLVD
jgi:hypothetical protein